MGLIRSSILVAAGIAIGGGLLLAHRVSQESGKSLTEAFADVPGEAQKLVTDIRSRADEAVTKGREAYQQKQAEVEDLLKDTSPSQ